MEVCSGKPITNRAKFVTSFASWFGSCLSLILKDVVVNSICSSKFTIGTDIIVPTSFPNESLRTFFFFWGGGTQKETQGGTQSILCHTSCHSIPFLSQKVRDAKNTR